MMASSGGGGGPVFGGTTQKCRACEKTVYAVEELTVDNRVYHRACFRCHHCKGTLKLSNYSSFEGVPYCKPHFDQLFKMTGSLDKSFEGVPKADRSLSQEGHAATKVSSMFFGTQEKCVACKKTVHLIEKVSVNDNSYHRQCFKCAYGNCVISPSNYVAHEGRLYCKHHHSQLFMQKGNFSQLDKHEVAKESNGNLASTEISTKNPASSDLLTANPVSLAQSVENPVSDHADESTGNTGVGTT